MLAKYHRFQGSRDIQRLYKAGQTARSKSFSARFRSDPGRPFRVVVIVSRKVHKSAVVRNRIRRRVYELVRTEHAHSLGSTQLSVTVFDASLATAPSSAVRRELASLLSKARVLASPKVERDILKHKGE